MRLKKLIAVLLTAGAISAMVIPASAEGYGNTTTDVTFLPGELLLEEMSSFGFGSHIINAANQKYPVLESKVYLNVLDLRGTGLGWKITAKGGTFNAPANSLPGTVIELSGGVAVPASAGNPSPNVTQNITLDMDGSASSPIAAAQAGTGLGIWSIEWNGSNVKLSVPEGIGTVGTHTATITWTLAIAP